METPSATFKQLLKEWIQSYIDSESFEKACYNLSDNCQKVRVVAKTIIIDIHWYPLDEHTHRNWYDVSINSIKNEAHFVGSSNELGDDFRTIIGLTDITANSEEIKQ